jgi:hypothetical protein
MRRHYQAFDIPRPPKLVAHCSSLVAKERQIHQGAARSCLAGDHIITAEPLRKNGTSYGSREDVEQQVKYFLWLVNEDPRQSHIPFGS